MLKEKTKAAAEAAKQAEKKRSERLMAGQREKVGRLEQRLRQMEKGTTPQTEGLEYEGRLVHALQREFPSDEIKHAGKNGDVLHTIRFERKQIGLIVYECKRVPKVKTPHIEQTRRAKNSREADFGVLVTTGKKKGFDGIGSESGVLIVTPQGVIPLVSLLRSNLVELDKAKVIKGQRALVANRLVEHITSPQFKNPIQDVIQRTRDLEDTIKQEAREHVRTWEKRWSHYQAISWESALLQRNMELILRGKQPEPLRPPKPAPLALPESTK
ncbi:MAG: DUF2130 domain-containing protein [Euryarchaeota archaeon]|nr:DUF2130 domain-containing protein [Euryarchaeota archaeon]